MIALTPCNSKMLQAFGYDTATQTLAVRFGPGKVYHYKDVPQDIADKMRDAESVGTCFAANVRNAFQFEVVVDEQAAAMPNALASTCG